MSERIAFLTGHLAQPRLEKVLAGMGETEFGWSVVNLVVYPPVVLGLLALTYSAIAHRRRIVAP